MSEHRVERLERAEGDDGGQRIDFTQYRDDPVGFCRLCGFESATRRSNGAAYQFEILDDLVTSPRVAVRSGHGIGKSALDAWAALWWLVTRPMSKVIVLAPEYSRQIRAVLFSEARLWAQRSRVKLPLDVLASEVLMHGYGREWSATGASTSGDPSRLEGFHASGGVLVIADEMKGIPTDAFAAIQGALTNAEKSRLLVTSVPGGAGGPFYGICVRERDRWKVHHIPSTDSSLVSPAWVDDKRIEWGGTASALYQMRVEGNFADIESGSMVAISTLEAMDKLYASQPSIPHVGETEEPCAGIDPAYTGDLCAVTITARRGDLFVVKECFVMPRTPDPNVLVVKLTEELVSRGIMPRRREVNPDLMTATGRPLDGYDYKWGPPAPYIWTGGWGALAVDQAGGGRGPAYALKNGIAGIPEKDQVRFHTTLFDSSMKPSRDPRVWLNRRAEAYGLVSDLMVRGKVAVAFDEHLAEELLATRLLMRPDGKRQVEDKDTIKTKLGRSPDRLDSLVMSIYGLVRPGGIPKQSPVTWG